MSWFKPKLYKKIYTDENINDAWRHIKLNSKLAGVDGVNVNLFQRHLLKNLKDIQEKLHSKKYTPQRIKRFWMQKPDGTKRPFGILTVRDRIVQRSVLQVIEPVFEKGFEDCSYAFRKGRSVDMAVANVNHFIRKGNYWVINSDIEQFFDNIDTDILYSFILEKLKDKELRKLIRTWLDTETSVICKKKFLWNSAKRGILQGSILSPLYANIYLDQFDKKVIKAGLKHVRFADNILAVIESEREAKKAIKIIRRTLNDLKLQLNKKKTEITHLEDGITFLGKRMVLKKFGKKASVAILDKHGHRHLQNIIKLEDYKKTDSTMKEVHEL